MRELSPFWSNLGNSKGNKPARIAFCDAEDPRVLKAITELSKLTHIHPLLIKTSDKFDIHKLAQDILPKVKKKDISINEIVALLKDPLYHGIAQLINGHVDGLVAGSTRPTADIVKASLSWIGPKKGVKLVSGIFLMESTHFKSASNTPFLFSDCAVIPEPSSRALASISQSGAEAYSFFTKEKPKVALLSFSTRDSAQHPLVDKIKEAVTILKRSNPSLVVDGEIQLDAAVDLGVAKIKGAGDSSLSGQSNVFIYPSLESGNIGYKLVQRFSQARVAGPVLWGLKKPVSDLSRGCTVQEIIDTSLCIEKMITGLK